MSDEAALLAAIISHPDEDTPRLMYADWLDEHGQPERAEFIRIQCDSSADETAEDRAVELSDRNRVRWLAGLPQFPGALWVFTRGFPEHLDVPAELFLDRYEAFTRSRWLRFLSIHGVWNAHIRDLCNRTWSQRWVELELQEHHEAIDDVFEYDATPTVVALAGCPQVDQLRLLRLSQFTFAYGESESPLESLRHRLGSRLVID